MRILIRFILIMVFAIGWQFSFCQVIDARICDSTNRFSITQYLSYLQTTKLITIDSAIKSLNFTKSKSEPVSLFNYDPYYYWFRIIVENKQDISRELMLVMAPVGMYDGELYQRINSNWRQVAHSGLKYRFQDRSYQFTHYVFPFTLPRESLDTLYVSIDASNVYKLFGFALIKNKDLKIFEGDIYFVFGIIVGLLVLFFVLNILLFFFLRNKLHLWYALYIALLFLIVMKNDQLDQQFLGLDTEKAFRLTPFATIGALAIGVFMHVVHSFFSRSIPEKNKWFNPVNTVLKINVFVSAVVHAFVFLEVSDFHIQNIVFNWEKDSISLCIVMIMVDCIYGVTKKIGGALFLFCGSFVFMIGSLQRLFFPTSLSFLFPPTTFHVGIIIETFVISVGLVYGYWLEEKKMEDSRKEVENFHGQLKQVQIETQEQTFDIISREIHDNVGQTLSLAKVQLNIIDQSQTLNKALLTDAKDSVSKAMTDLRDIAKSLNSDRIKLSSLVELTDYELQRINRAGIMITSFVTKGTEQNMLQHKKLFVYRIIQEVLQNILKHSKATNIDIIFQYGKEKLAIDISDNGTGFDKELITKKDGIGLQNIISRAALIGGEAHINSNINKGTTLTIISPYA